MNTPFKKNVVDTFIQEELDFTIQSKKRQEARRKKIIKVLRFSWINFILTSKATFSSASTLFYFIVAILIINAAVPTEAEIVLSKSWLILWFGLFAYYWYEAKQNTKEVLTNE